MDRAEREEKIMRNIEDIAFYARTPAAPNIPAVYHAAKEIVRLFEERDNA